MEIGKEESEGDTQELVSYASPEAHSTTGGAAMRGGGAAMRGGDRQKRGSERGTRRGGARGALCSWMKMDVRLRCAGNKEIVQYTWAIGVCRHVAWHARALALVCGHGVGARASLVARDDVE